MIAEATASNLVVTVEGSIIDFVGPALSVLRCWADSTNDARAGEATNAAPSMWAVRTQLQPYNAAAGSGA